MRVLFGGLIAATLLAGGVVLGLFLYGRHGNTIDQMTPAALMAALADHSQIIMPQGYDGTAPVPVAIFLSGCGGDTAILQSWAHAINDQGYAIVMPDSFAAHGLTPAIHAKFVCRHFLMRADERQADILAMIGWLGTQEWADTNRIVLAGWSHGGWTIIDLLARTPDEAPPPTLTAMPQDHEGNQITLAGIKGTILFYPYCGTRSLAATSGLTHHPQTLMIVGADDKIIDPEDCLAFAAREQAKGWAITPLLYPHTGHGFDVDLRPDGVRNPGYRPDIVAKVEAEIAGFLQHMD